MPAQTWAWHPPQSLDPATNPKGTPVTDKLLALRPMMLVVMLVYIAVIYAISVYAQRRVSNTEDYLVAGRRLPLSLAWMTLVATWFGAGTLLAVTGEVRDEGVKAAAIDPIGAGLCLILAGWLVAGRLWAMNLLTVCDFFRLRFGRTAELVAGLILVPSYFGWLAAQFRALADLLQLYLGMDAAIGLAVVAVLSTGYTLMGGMWSVTLTDAFQIVIVFVGLLVMAWTAFAALGGGEVVDGVRRLLAETPAEMLNPVRGADATEILQLTSVVLIGALGNLPGQDLLQRVFASNSAKTARLACFVSGVVYIGFGLIPVALALVARILVPEQSGTAVLPALAGFYLHPFLAVLFVTVVLSAVLSTIVSALLAPSGILTQNIFTRCRASERFSLLTLNRVAVLIVAVGGLVSAYLGESAYDLLQDSYSLILVSLVVPLLAGLYLSPRGEWSALACMTVGAGLWLCHWLQDWDTFGGPDQALFGVPVPAELGHTLVGLAVFFAVRLVSPSTRSEPEA
jgi:Na+/proline symporter